MCWPSATLLPKPSLPYCRKEMRQVTYRFSWISFVSTLPRLTLLSLHTTTQPVTASCLLEPHSIRSHVSATHMLRSNSAQKESESIPRISLTVHLCLFSTSASKDDNLTKQEVSGSSVLGLCKGSMGLCLPFLNSSLTSPLHYSLSGR